MDPNRILLALFNDVLGSHLSETLNDMTNTELINLFRMRLVERLRNEAFDMGHEMSELYDSNC